MILRAKVQMVAALSAFASIVFVGWTSHYFVHGSGWVIINTSLGAAAIILFASPRSEYARPRALIGGQVVAALVGVSVAYLIQNIYVASAVAVSVSIIIMFNLRCLFPPAGACALTPILGEETLHTLGFQYVLTPVLLNAVLICMFAWLVDKMILERQQGGKEQTLIDRGLPINSQDVEQAVASMDAYIDASQQDLLEIYARAQKQARKRLLTDKYRKRKL